MLKRSIIVVIIVLFTIIFNNNHDVIESKYDNGYYGYLNIPKIGMQLGFYNYDNKLNNVNNNIEIIKTNIEDTYLLAGHSGTGKVSFFNNLRYLEIRDIVILSIGDINKEYIVVDILTIKKNGKLVIDKKSGYLYLTTCDQVNKGYQLTIKCKEVTKN
jgi:LPXTG-site transpeptidase (sortase) family protein